MSNLIGSAEELLRELVERNHNDEAISIDWLAQMLEVRECIRRGKSSDRTFLFLLVGVQQRKHPIYNWTTEDIKSWAKDLKQQRQARTLPNCSRMYNVGYGTKFQNATL
uniref:DUF29 domain-containing protein n=1 Tax=Globodera pallida TaxID=36090 RepID=A0A183CJR9_GLOPA